MYMGGMLKNSPVRSTGLYKGSSCPAGQVRIKTTQKYEKSGPMGFDWVTYSECGVAPKAAPPPRPAPKITVAPVTKTTVSPSFQQAFTPQVSPNIQVSSGGGSQQAGNAQTAPGGQKAAGGSTDSPAADNDAALKAAAEQQRQAAEIELLKARLSQQAVEEKAAALETAPLAPTAAPGYSGGGSSYAPVYIPSDGSTISPEAVSTNQPQPVVETNYMPAVVLGLLAIGGILYQNSHKRGKR